MHVRSMKYDVLYTHHTYISLLLHSRAKEIKKQEIALKHLNYMINLNYYYMIPCEICEINYTFLRNTFIKHQIQSINIIYSKYLKTVL